MLWKNHVQGKRKCVKHILDFCPESSCTLSGHWVSIHTRWLTGPRWGCVQMTGALDQINRKLHGAMSATKTSPDWVLPNARCQAADTWVWRQVTRLFLFIAQGLPACNRCSPWLFPRTLPVWQEEFAVPSNELSLAEPDPGYCQRARDGLGPTPT